MQGSLPGQDGSRSSRRLGARPHATGKGSGCRRWATGMTMTTVLRRPATRSQTTRTSRLGWLLGAVIVVGLVVGLLVSQLSSGPSGGSSAGPLRVKTQIYGNRILLQSEVGRSNTWGYLVLENPTQQAATITKVSLSTKLRVVHLALGKPTRGWHAAGGLYQRWPPLDNRPGDLLTLPVTIPPHESSKLFAELVIPHPGRFPIDPTVRVQYRIGKASYTRVYAPPKPDLLYTNH